MKLTLVALAFAIFIGACAVTAQNNLVSSKLLFAENCAGCHVVNGNGEGDIPDLRRKPENYCTSKTQEDEKYQILVNGGIKKDKSGPGTMPAWGNALSQEQIRGLLAYIKTLCP